MFLVAFALSVSLHAAPSTRPVVSFTRDNAPAMHCTTRALVQGSGNVRTCEAVSK